MWHWVRTCLYQTSWLEEPKSWHTKCFHISLPGRMKLSLQFRVTEMTSSKHPSFGWNLVYFGITLTFLIQTLGSPLLADYYRGTLRKYHDCKNSLKQLLFVKGKYLSSQIKDGDGDADWVVWKRITYNIQSDFFPYSGVRFVLTIDCWWYNKYCHVRHKLEFPYFRIQQIASTENVFSLYIWIAWI